MDTGNIKYLLWYICYRALCTIVPGGLTVSAYRLASNSIQEKQVDRYLAMLDHYYSFVSEYPDSKRIKELERMAKDARNFLDKNRKTEE